MPRQNPPKARPISSLTVGEREDADEDENEDLDVDEDEDEYHKRKKLWDKRFPEVHDIEVKYKGKDARWECIKAILTQHRDNSRRGRRVWISFSGSQPTTEELALEWPQDSERAGPQRKLRDKAEDSYLSVFHKPRVFKVTEKMGGDGRRCWREVIAVGEVNDEEREIEWDEMMRDEGFYDEIERLMEKE